MNVGRLRNTSSCSLNILQTTGAIMTKLERAKFRVKIRSLAEEAKIIRHEEKKANRGLDCDVLHQHRVGSLRNEARCTLLAYALIRGVPYANVERSSRIPDGNRVRAIVKSLTARVLSYEEFRAWFNNELCLAVA